MNNGRRIPWWGWIIIAVVSVAAIGTFIVFRLWIPVSQALIAAFQWLTTPVEVKDPRYLYLLSAAAQAQAAIFAIVFALAPLIIQRLSKYTDAPMRIIFNRWVLAYIFSFALAVALPLWLLRSPASNGALVATIVATLCALSIAWFFWYIIRWTNLPRIIDRLQSEVLDAITRR